MYDIILKGKEMFIRFSVKEIFPPLLFPFTPTARNTMLHNKLPFQRQLWQRIANLHAEE